MLHDDDTSMPMGVARNSGWYAGGLLPVCRGPPVTAWIIRGRTRLGFRVPRAGRRVKGGVSSPAEDLLPVSEVEAGVNFRPAGGVREQVAGSLPGRQPGTGTRQVREVLVTPSLHPEVPGIQFVSPGYADWASGNRWAGRRCVEPHGRGFGC